MTTTVVTPSRTSFGVAQFASGKITGDGNTTQINLGFVPRWFKLYNETDTIIWEKTTDTTAADCWKYTSSANALDTGSHVLFTGDGTTLAEGVGYVTCDTTAIPNSKVYSWVAHD